MADLEDKLRAKKLSDMGLKVIICVPLITWERVDGVLNLASRKDISLDNDTIDLLVTVGNQVAVAVHNARLHQELQGRIAMLKEKKDMIQFFAYSISHDLKNPAVGIYGLTKRLYEKNASRLDEKGLECCELILKTTEYMLQLVDRLNSYISAKEGTLCPESIEMGGLLDSIRMELDPQITARGITWIKPNLIPVIVADRLSLTRALRNLIDNALKYGGPDLKKIAVEYREEGEFHILSVWDDGVPIGPELAGRIFEPFQRDPSSKGVAGSGLGMAIVKEVAERHGGKAWVDTACPKGARISLSIKKGLTPHNPLNNNER